MEEEILGKYEEREWEVLEEGSYEATLEDIERRTIVIQEDGQETEREVFNWIFDVDGIKVRGTTSTIISTRSKAGKWVEALLGRRLEDGETIKKGDLIGRKCLVYVIQKPGKVGDIVFNNVKDVMPLPKKGGKKK